MCMCARVGHCVCAYELACEHVWYLCVMLEYLHACARVCLFVCVVQDLVQIVTGYQIGMRKNSVALFKLVTSRPK